MEVLPVEIEIPGDASPEEYPLQKKRHSFEFLREIAHLRPRTNTFGSVMRVRNAMSFAIHKYFNDNGFVYVHTPIITGSDCEGAGEMFHVTNFDLNNIPRSEGKIDFSKDFFGKEASLTVSGQLEAGDLCHGSKKCLYIRAPHSVLKNPIPQDTLPSSGWWNRKWHFVI